MNYIFFDTETNGKPKDYKAKVSDLDNWPRLAQISWLVADDAGEILESDSYYIYPDGWGIPNEKFFIDNGMSTGLCIDKGKHIKYVLVKFLLACGSADLMVAHNMQFDYNVVGSEIIRAAIKTNKKTQRFCTMEATTDLLKLPGFYGNFKWPKLEELYKYCFDRDFDNKHNAIGDVTALYESFFYLKTNNLITI